MHSRARRDMSRNVLVQALDVKDLSGRSQCDTSCVGKRRRMPGIRGGGMMTWCGRCTVLHLVACICRSTGRAHFCDMLAPLQLSASVACSPFPVPAACASVTGAGAGDGFNARRRQMKQYSTAPCTLPVPWGLRWGGEMIVGNFHQSSSSSLSICGTAGALPLGSTSGAPAAT